MYIYIYIYIYMHVGRLAPSHPGRGWSLARRGVGPSDRVQLRSALEPEICFLPIIIIITIIIIIIIMIIISSSILYIV